MISTVFYSHAQNPALTRYPWLGEPYKVLSSITILHQTPYRQRTSSPPCAWPPTWTRPPSPSWRGCRGGPPVAPRTPKQRPSLHGHWAGRTTRHCRPRTWCRHGRTRGHTWGKGGWWGGSGDGAEERWRVLDINTNTNTIPQGPTRVVPKN